MTSEHTRRIAEDERHKWVSETQRSLSDEDKIGQLIVSFCPDPSETALTEILAVAPGGLYRPTGMSTRDLVESTNFLHQESKIAPLIAGDLEYGSFGFLQDGTDQQVQLGIAATGDPVHARNMGNIAGTEMRAVGYNWILSPVVDVLKNFRSTITGPRSFGDDPDTVVSMATEYIHGVRESGLAACLKHWPGDGVDSRDQHLLTTVNSLSAPEWEESFGRVYRKLIATGVRTVMSAHIALWFRDGGTPGTLSSQINLRLLREELGFEGLILSDATAMAGLADQGPRETVLPLVIENGCDMIIAGDGSRDFEILRAAVSSGTLSRRRLDDAVRRVLTLKASLGLHHRPAPLSVEAAMASLRSEEHVRWSEAAAAASITLVRDDQSLLPIDPRRKPRVLVIRSEPESTFFGRPSGHVFEERTAEEGFQVTEFENLLDTPPADFDLLVYLLDEREYFGMGRYHPSWAKLHGGMLESLYRFWHTVPTLVISFHNPFHLYDVPAAKTYINAYSSAKAVQEALVDLLVGRKPFVGKSPVNADLA